ncbi:MAG TPA: carbon-nitrogen hydrolase family protein [Polyangiaceae bacterium]|nr:carbon-nitrogen hydrolase family protein [Polyangiaceae bacterium]
MPDARPVAAAQTIPVRGDVAANLAEHVRLMALAAERDVELLVFPELSLTGYELDLAFDLAFSEQDARLDELRELALSLAMTLVVGAPTRSEEGLHIGAFIVSASGSLELYTKRRLGAFRPEVNPHGVVPPAESSVFAAGVRDPLLSFAGHTAALAICADIGDPMHAVRAAARGADLLLASMFVIPADLATESTRLEGFARQHSLNVVFSNYGGPSGGLPAAGCSAIWSAQGKLLTELESSGAGIAVATL